MNRDFPRSGVFFKAEFSNREITKAHPIEKKILMPSTTGAMPLTQVSLTVVFLEAVLFRAISSERESTSNMIQLTF